MRLRNVVLSFLIPVAVVAQEPHTLSFADAVRLAAEHGAPAQAARARVDQAEARVHQRRGDLLPSVSAIALRSGRQFNTATLGFDFKGPSGESFFNPRGVVLGPVNSVDLRARISQSLVDLGAVGRMRAAQATASATAVDVDIAAEQSAVNAALAYARVARGEAQVQARASDSTLAAELLTIAQDQLTAGVGVALDVTRARAQLATVRAQLLSARTERDRARLELLRALSLPADSPIQLADSLTGLADRDLGGAEASARRPELRSLDAQRVAVDGQVHATQLERLPVLSAFGDHGPIQGNGGAYLSTYSFGIQLAIPLFDGFKRDGRLEEERAQARELDIRRHDMEQQSELDVKSASLDVTAANEQVVAARERLVLGEQEVAQARDRFRAGVTGNADVVTASLSLSQARTQLVDALAAQLNSRIALARARGVARSLR